jgi:hypothetical protein
MKRSYVDQTKKLVSEVTCEFSEVAVVRKGIYLTTHQQHSPNESRSPYCLH